LCQRLVDTQKFCGAFLERVLTFLELGVILKTHSNIPVRFLVRD
jgi:hypothetical protein